MTKIGLSLSLVAFVGVMVASTLSAQAQSAEVRLKASMVSGVASGKAEYRERGNRKRLNVQAEDLAGTTVSPQNVYINGVSIGKGHLAEAKAAINPAAAARGAFSRKEDDDAPASAGGSCGTGDSSQRDELLSKIRSNGTVTTKSE